MVKCPPSARLQVEEAVNGYQRLQVAAAVVSNTLLCRIISFAKNCNCSSGLERHKPQHAMASNCCARWNQRVSIHSGTSAIVSETKGWVVLTSACDMHRCACTNCDVCVAHGNCTGAR